METFLTWAIIIFIIAISNINKTKRKKNKKVRTNTASSPVKIRQPAQNFVESFSKRYREMIADFDKAMESDRWSVPENKKVKVPQQSPVPSLAMSETKKAELPKNIHAQNEKTPALPTDSLSEKSTSENLLKPRKPKVLSKDKNHLLNKVSPRNAYLVKELLDKPVGLR